ncbi:MAG: hypothetical protein BGO78_12655 [Chloroflexi bacterium 44-23]|nr:MAG: hypothetical protein BGO78_12655 [Chloroflexi bacterium 44-23]
MLNEQIDWVNKKNFQSWHGQGRAAANWKLFSTNQMVLRLWLIQLLDVATLKIHSGSRAGDFSVVNIMGINQTEHSGFATFALCRNALLPGSPDTVAGLVSL